MIALCVSGDVKTQFLLLFLNGGGGGGVMPYV